MKFGSGKMGVWLDSWLYVRFICIWPRFLLRWGGLDHVSRFTMGAPGDRSDLLLNGLCTSSGSGYRMEDELFPKIISRRGAMRWSIKCKGAAGTILLDGLSRGRGDLSPHSSSTSLVTGD